jgi:hypothetical protein
VLVFKILPLKGSADFDQIYTGAGLGFKTKLTDHRFTIEGKYNRYNFNAVKTYLQRKIKPTLVSPMLTLKLKH